MKLKINQELVGLDGKAIAPTVGTKLTLKEVCVNSLLSPMEGDGEKEKFEKWEIYKKLRDAKTEADLTINDLATIKKCVGKFQPPLILGQVFEMIEQKDKS